MAVSLWDHVNEGLDGKLKEMLTQWHTEERKGTPAIAKQLNALGYEVGQNTVWRWTKEHDIRRGD